MSDSDNEEPTKDPYRDDPDWAPWHAEAVDVQGGPDDNTSSDEDEQCVEASVTFPENCICQCCRFVYNCKKNCKFS
jgi:hypothetical protein